MDQGMFTFTLVKLSLHCLPSYLGRHLGFLVLKAAYASFHQTHALKVYMEFAQVEPNETRAQVQAQGRVLDHRILFIATHGCIFALHQGAKKTLDVQVRSDDAREHRLLLLFWWFATASRCRRRWRKTYVECRLFLVVGNCAIACFIEL